MSTKNDVLRALMPQQKSSPNTDNASATTTAAASAPATGRGSGFLSGLTDNPLFNAGAGIAILGAALTAMRSSGKQVISIAKRYVTTSLEVTSKDHSYAWLLQWISAKAGRNATQLGVETRFTRHHSGKIDTTFGFVPAPGRHWFWYGGRLITVHRERDPSVIDLKHGTPWESVKLTTVGRSRTVFTQLLSEAKDVALQKEEGHTLIYTMGHISATAEPKWEQFGQARKRRPLDSVVLSEGQKERIVSDLKEFTASQKWYLDRGIPYRRGYLLYGPPGCGKTSFIAALAGELQYNICILNLNERGLTDDKLALMLANAPPRSIILLEDVDAAFVRRDAKFAYNVTFSGLLNTLDGVASSEERIIFMTTNHIERLDPALIRPGRVDLKEEITYASPYQVMAMFLRFYPSETERATAFVARLGDAPLSMASVQGYFMSYKGDAAAALEHCQTLLDDARETAKRNDDHKRFHEAQTAAQQIELAKQIAAHDRILSPAPPRTIPSTAAAAAAAASSRRDTVPTASSAATSTTNDGAISLSRAR